MIVQDSEILYRILHKSEVFRALSTEFLNPVQNSVLKSEEFHIYVRFSAEMKIHPDRKLRTLTAVLRSAERLVWGFSFGCIIK